MKKQSKKQHHMSRGDVTLAEFFKLIDDVAKKAKTNPTAQKIIESAEQKWQSDSKYAF